MEKSTVSQEALKYESIGFSVMPLGNISKNSEGKKTIGYPPKWKKYQTTRATPEEILSWNCKNLGVVTGSISKIFVLDIDSYKPNHDSDLVKSLALPVTPVSQTASGGRQYFFKLPDNLKIKNDVCIGNKGSGIDIRGEGGMVIVPPSITLYGEYKWLISPFDEVMADIPPKLLELLKPHVTTLKNRKNLTDLIGIREGEGRNNAMASLIGKLLLTTHPDKWDEEVWPAAIKVNKTHQPPLDLEELEKIFESITKIERSRRLKLFEPKTDSSPPTFPPAVSHSELISIIFPPVRYSLEPFFEQGTMNMVSAAPNNWKSWLLFLFAGHIAKGTHVFEKFSTAKASVMIVNEEDSARLIQDRLKLLKITDPELSIFYRIGNGSKLKDEFVDSLIIEAKEKNIGVIMFDSFRAVHDVDENNSKEMQGILDQLKKISRQNITTIFTHHHRKKTFGNKGDDAEASRGSSAINAAVSGHISLEEVESEEGKKIVVRHLKSKVGEKIKPFEVAIETGETMSFQYLGEHKLKEHVLTEVKRKILDELATREELLSRKDFAHLGIGGATTIKKATQSLCSEKKIQARTRKEIEKINLKTLSPGSANEILFSLVRDNELNVFDLPIQNEDLGIFDDKPLEEA